VPGLELLIASLLAVAFIALHWILRRERLARQAGERSTMHPFTLGLYRGCAFLAFLFALYVAAMIVIGLLSRPPVT
jgi:hypothetical protein